MTLAFRTRNPKLVELLCEKEVPLEISEYPPDIFTKEEDVRMLHLLLEAGADPERVIKDEMVGFPLVLAAERGSLETVRLLLKHGARENVYDPRKHGSALQAATAYGHCDIVEALLSSRSRADIVVPSNSKYRPLLDKVFQDPHCDVALAMQRAARTPIQIAASNNDLEMAKLLLGHGAHLNSRRAAGYHEKLLENQPRKTEVEEYGALKALQYAIANQNTKLVWLLLYHGAYPDLQGHIFSDTPLQMSASLGNEKLVRMLLDARAKVNAPPKRFKGRTALQAAAETGNLKVAELLLEHGADVNAPPAHNGGLTAIQAAALKGHGPMFEFLLAKGADIYAPPANREGLTPLQAAAIGGHGHMIVRIIALGADSEYMAPQGVRTALQAVIRHKNPSLISALVSNSASINPGTALQEASKHRWFEAAAYLLSRGAEVNVQPHGAASAGNHLTALGWAIQNDDVEMTKLLLRSGADAQCAQDTACSSPTALLFALHRGKSPDMIELLLGSANKLFFYAVIHSAVVAAINGHYSSTSVYNMLFSNIPATNRFLTELCLQQALVADLE
jgi:ankyrin repeat protein